MGGDLVPQRAVIIGLGGDIFGICSLFGAIVRSTGFTVRKNATSALASSSVIRLKLKNGMIGYS